MAVHPQIRRGAIGGVLGPIAFVGGWSLLGASRTGYSLTSDTISQLAALGAPTRAAMTAVLVAYAIGLVAYATAIRQRFGSAACGAALLNAAATLGVAATPLGSGIGGVPHAVATATGYATLAALPVLAAHHRRSALPPALGRGAPVWSGAIAAALVTSVIAGADPGFWQRLGLTVGDVWLVSSALVVLRSSTVVRRADPTVVPTGARWPTRSAA